MATEKLTRAVVSGPIKVMDEAIRTLMLDREFQPLQASSTLGAAASLRCRTATTSTARPSTAR